MVKRNAYIVHLMSEQSEVVLVTDDSTWHIWQDNKQWKMVAKVVKTRTVVQVNRILSAN